LDVDNLSFRPKIIRPCEWDEGKAVAEIREKAGKNEKINMLKLICHPLRDKSARYYDKAPEALESAGRGAPWQGRKNPHRVNGCLGRIEVLKCG
jgi:hypothetical protein